MQIGLGVDRDLESAGERLLILDHENSDHRRLLPAVTLTTARLMAAHLVSGFRRRAPAGRTRSARPPVEA
ncbi:hypothetical protein Mame01_53130 [Microbispora amethystogenes]|nr:hypothetical protein Mame01_53130 [Microbispora amethystogenes]